MKNGLYANIDAKRKRIAEEKAKCPAERAKASLKNWNC
jgi:hypothetical protein